MFKQLDYTMVVVSDMQRSVDFYRDTLVGVSILHNSFPQGSREPRQPWAELHNRFAVTFPQSD
jgi:hypothetical protein